MAQCDVSQGLKESENQKEGKKRLGKGAGGGCFNVSCCLEAEKGQAHFGNEGT